MHPLKKDNLDQYRKEYNNMILEKLSESDDIIQEKYITVTVFKNNIEEKVLSLRTAAKRNHPVGTFGTVASVVSAAGSGTDINRNN